MHLVMTSHYNTGYDNDNTSSCITVSLQPKDVTVISSYLPPGPGLSDQFVYPIPEQMLQLTNQLNHKPVKCEVNVCHLAKMQALQERIKDAPKCSTPGSTIAFPKFVITKNGL